LNNGNDSGHRASGQMLSHEGCSASSMLRRSGELAASIDNNEEKRC
jgi:hypothetical protein